MSSERKKVKKRPCKQGKRFDFMVRPKHEEVAFFEEK